MIACALQANEAFAEAERQSAAIASAYDALDEVHALYELGGSVLNLKAPSDGGGQ